MAVTQYIGSRYVPLIADPIEWSSATAYEPLTIVIHNGNSYTSRQYVPVGIDITNDDFWALTGNYNAQIEQYRRDVAEFQDDIEHLQEDVLTLDLQLTSEGQIRQEEIEALHEAIDGKFPVTTENIANSAITPEKIADAAVTTRKIADAAVTTSKIADGSITPSKFANNALTNIENQLAGTSSSGLLTLINRYKRKPELPATYFYIDYINGNDNNNGLTAATAFKTMDKFLEQETNGYTDLYCYMISAGTYKIHDHRITNTSIHFYATVPNVILSFDFESTPIFYNSYIHFEGVSDGYLRVHTRNIASSSNKYAFHADSSTVYARYVRFTGQGTFDVSLGSLQFNTVIVDTTPLDNESTIQLRISQGMLQNTTFTNANQNRYLLHLQASLAFITGTLTLPTYTGTNEGGIFRAQGSMLFVSSTFDISTDLCKFDNVVKLEQSFFQISDGMHNELIGHATNSRYTGNQSVVNHRYSINDIS